MAEALEVKDVSPFYTFVGSLPAFPVSWDSAKALPISPIRLEGRIDHFLTKEDHDTIHFFERTLFGFNFDADEVFLDKADQIMERSKKYSRQLTDACSYLIKMRLMVALIRRSIKNKGLPHNFQERWVPFIGKENAEIITKKWNTPDFGLKLYYPWIEEMRGYIENDQALKSEELLTHMQWETLSDMDFDSGFDMSGALLYVFRWHVMRQWITHMPEESLEIINQKVNRIVEQTEINHES